MRISIQMFVVDETLSELKHSRFWVAVTGIEGVVGLGDPLLQPLLHLLLDRGMVGITSQVPHLIGIGLTVEQPDLATFEPACVGPSCSSQAAPEPDPFAAVGPHDLAHRRLPDQEVWALRRHC